MIETKGFSPIWVSVTRVEGRGIYVVVVRNKNCRVCNMLDDGTYSYETSVRVIPLNPINLFSLHYSDKPFD